MDRVHYAGDHFLTGSRIARALLEYAAALARFGSASSVDIPVRHDDGSDGTATILVGPASQLISEHVDHEGDEIIDEALVERLRGLTAELAPIRPVVVDPNSNTDRPVDYDWTDEV
ncbi:hypothetical protein [Agromyces sp. Marseille-P2726]|uniref:hypothetical protein n=1 Tax=Agromyces sp. Marseille-P2726 TaxID=2709132 RepID=UPI00156DD97C|nr:hypothetical protein [Agromyces sp. Marseille-P2726]